MAYGVPILNASLHYMDKHLTNKAIILTIQEKIGRTMTFAKYQDES